MKKICIIFVSLALSLSGLALAEDATVPAGGNPPADAPAQPAPKAAKKSGAKSHKRVSKPKARKGAGAPKSASRRHAPVHKAA